MDLFDIAQALADYLHDDNKTFADVSDQLERQVNQTLDLMRQDDEQIDVTKVDAIWPDPDARPTY